MISKCKKNYKLVVAFILGIIVSGLVVYAATIESSNISYDNSSSGLSSTTLKGAIDELYEKSDIRKMGNFISAYTYNQTSGASNYCVTGEEETCKRTNCYKIKTGGSCKAGDIIKYKVNDTDIIAFHVMFDKGNNLIMQTQQGIISNTPWISNHDYLDAGGDHLDDHGEYGMQGDSTLGPLTALENLENATENWTNVNIQTYTMGETIFEENNAYTGCDVNADEANPYNCSSLVYTLPEKISHARMITVQEAHVLGCEVMDTGSCPKWMAGPTYWTMTANSLYTPTANVIAFGKLFRVLVADKYNIRAVVVISK